MAEKKEEIRISYFDPVANAYREIPLELAEKFVESAKEVEKKIKELKEKK
jgi:hypothetical protein